MPGARRACVKADDLTDRQPSASRGSRPDHRAVGYGQPSDRVRTMAAGFIEHLVKPIDVQQLRVVLERYVCSA